MEFLKLFRLKYLVLLVVALTAAYVVFGSASARPVMIYPSEQVREGDSAAAATTDAVKSDTAQQSVQDASRRTRRITPAARRSGGVQSAKTDSIAPKDSLAAVQISKPDTARQKKGSIIDQVISGKNTDSLHYDVRNKRVYIFNQGDIKYENMGLQADYMQIDMNTKEIYAYGKADSVDGKVKNTHPVFSEGGSSYTMDTITYNFGSKKAFIQGVATQEGDGWLVGGQIKKMPDNSINIRHGKYTTCDHTDNPHFYLAMTKAKVIPGKKIITGPAYLVMHDVPIYFACIPEGFFPVNMGPKSGLLMPSYGEDASRGFFIRGLGYYFIINKHIDLALTGGIYTLGSWEVNASSRYVKRYKYRGNINFDFSAIKTGDKGEPDYIKQNNFRFTWTHSQDPKANPGSTFSASVNLSSSGYSKYSATTLNDILATQTNSTISRSEERRVGKECVSS